MTLTYITVTMQIFAMTVRLSSYFEEQMQPILTHFLTGQRPMRSRRWRASNSDDPQPSAKRQGEWRSMSTSRQDGLLRHLPPPVLYAGADPGGGRWGARPPMGRSFIIQNTLFNSI